MSLCRISLNYINLSCKREFLKYASIPLIITQTFWLLLHQVWGLTSFRKNSSNPSGQFLRWSVYWDLWFQQEIFSYPELKLNRNSISIFSTHSYFFKVFNHHYYSIYSLYFKIQCSKWLYELLQHHLISRWTWGKILPEFGNNSHCFCTLWLSKASSRALNRGRWSGYWPLKSSYKEWSTSNLQQTMQSMHISMYVTDCWLKILIYL